MQIEFYRITNKVNKPQFFCVVVVTFDMKQPVNTKKRKIEIAKKVLSDPTYLNILGSSGILFKDIYTNLNKCRLVKLNKNGNFRLQLTVYYCRKRRTKEREE